MKDLKLNIDFFIILAVWVVIILLINPIGNFPLNDDWSYARTIKIFKNTGQFKIVNWGEMTLIAHLIWGYIFNLFTEFSYTTLRLSTLALGYFSLIGIYQIGGLLNYKRWHKYLLVILVMINPIFLTSSFTFMTDVPFMAAGTWSIYYFIKAYETEKSSDLWLAILFCVWAILIRQLALFIPLAWLFANILKRKGNAINYFKIVMPLLVVTFSYFIYLKGMSANGLLQERYNDKFSLLIKTFFNPNLKTIFSTLGYFALSMIYLAAFFIPLFIKNRNYSTIKKILIFTSGFLITFVLYLSNKLIPCFNGVLTDNGVGPLSLYYTNSVISEDVMHNNIYNIWTILTFMGSVASIYLLLYCYRKLNLKPLSRLFDNFKFSQLFALFCCIIYLTPLSMVSVYDRYLLSLFPVLIIFLGDDIRDLVYGRWQKIFAIVFIFGLGLFSVCAVHDYMSWNRVRWQIVNELIDDGVALNQINGGIEYVADNFFKENKNKWWDELDPRYTLLFNADGFSNYKKYNYSKWMPGKGEIYLITEEQ